MIAFFLCLYRSVYDDQPNAHKKFMEKLDACIRNHDKEIEKMCNFHHQGFVDAITELLKVRTDAEKLKVRNMLKFYLPLLSNHLQIYSAYLQIVITCTVFEKWISGLVHIWECFINSVVMLMTGVISLSLFFGNALT